ncbi:MAG: sensor domain-containing diguanylate cyclase [Gammaproteobacteria bacterium]
MASSSVLGSKLLPEFIQVLTELVVEQDFSRFFERAAGAAAGLINADGAALIMREQDDALCYRFFLGVPAKVRSRLNNHCFPASWGTAGKALRELKPAYNPDYPTCRYAMLEYVAAGLKSNLVIPVLSGERAIGVLAVSWFYQPGPATMDEHAIELVQLLANMIGAALHRQQLSSELIRQAHQDALTGLGNRAMLTDRLEHAMNSAQRGEHLVAVLILDIDGFKRVNDRMGHAAGDRLLQEVASRLRDIVRVSDTLIRLGGDEFVILLENARTLSEVNRVISRVITALKIRISINGRTEQVSASLGATVYPLDDVSPDSLIVHADNAMYVAKNRGGNHYSYFDKFLEQQQFETEKIEQEIPARRQLTYRRYPVL